MTKIQKYVDQIDEELCGAKHYAEKYVEYKAKNNMQRAGKYKEMANDELKHAMIIHDYATQDIEELEKVFKPTKAMEDAWNDSHTEYTEKTAWIKQMLAM